LGVTTLQLAPAFLNVYMSNPCQLPRVPGRPAGVLPSSPAAIVAAEIMTIRCSAERVVVT
jgi:hypothetical protein